MSGIGFIQHKEWQEEILKLSYEEDDFQIATHLFLMDIKKQ